MRVTIAELIAILAMDATKFKEGVKVAETAASRLGKNLEKIGKRAMKMITLPILAVGTASVKMAMDFETQITSLHTIMDEATIQSRDWGQEVLNLSKEVGESSGVLAAGLYDLIGSGIDASKAMGVLEIAAKSAKAGMTDTATATKVLAAVLNSYSLQAEDAERVADILFATVNYGVITFEELAGSIGRVLPIAAASNISLEELGAALTVMTLGGLDANMAVTALNATILSFLKPTPDAVEIAESLGINFSATALAGDGLYGTLKKVSEALGLTANDIEALSDATLTEAEQQKLLAERTGLTTEQLASMFTNVRALIGVLSLLKGGGEEYDKQMQNMEKTAGSMGTAFEKIAQTTKFQFDLMISSLKATGIEIGTKLLPLVTKLFKAVGGLAGKFGDLSDEAQTTVIVLGGVAAAIGPLIYGLGKTISLVSQLGVLFGTTTIAAAGFTSVIGALLTGIAGLTYLRIRFIDPITRDLLGLSGQTRDVGNALDSMTMAIEKNAEKIMEWRFGNKGLVIILDELTERYEAGNITLREYDRALEFLIRTKGEYIGTTEEVLKNSTELERALNLEVRASQRLHATAQDGIPILDETGKVIGYMGDAADDAASDLDELRSSFNKLVNAIFENITTFTEFKLSQFAVIAAEKELEEAEKELEKAQKATGATFTANDEALHTYLSTNIKYLENQKSQTKLQNELNEFISKGDTTSLEYLKTKERLNTVQAEGNKIIDGAVRKTGTYISTGEQTEAQLEKVIEKEEEYYRALQAVDRAVIQLITDGFKLSTSVKATTEQQDEARESAVRLGLQYVETGKIGISEFMQLAEEFKLSKGDIIRMAIEMGFDLDKCFRGVEGSGTSAFRSLTYQFDATGDEIIGTAQKIGMNIDDELLEAKQKGINHFIDLARRFGLTGEEIILKAQDLGIELDEATKARIIKITADTSQATSMIQRLEKFMGSIKDKTVTITVKQRLEKFMGMGGIIRGDKGAIIGVPKAAYGYVVPQTGREVPVIAHEGEVLLNTSQQGNIARWIMNKAMTRPEGLQRVGDIKNIFNIATLVVREEADVEKVADELYEKQIGEQRGVGYK